MLTSSFLAGIQANPDIPDSVSSQAQVELAPGIPFISDADLKPALEQAGLSGAEADAIVAENAQARLDGLQSALSVLCLIALIALFFARNVPTKQPGVAEPEEEVSDDTTPSVPTP